MNDDSSEDEEATARLVAQCQRVEQTELGRLSPLVLGPAQFGPFRTPGLARSDPYGSAPPAQSAPASRAEEELALSVPAMLSDGGFHEPAVH